MSHDIQGIEELPSIDDVRRRSQGLALLDAIIMPDWEHRYFSFNCRWSDVDGEMMASMRNGSDDEYFLHFSKNGAVGKAIDANPLANSCVFLAQIPKCFSDFKNESAFQVSDAAYYFWRETGGKWFSSPENLKLYPNLRFLSSEIIYYHEWAVNYYERDIDFNVLRKVFNTLSINQEQLTVLNSDLILVDLVTDLREILGVF